VFKAEAAIRVLVNKNVQYASVFLELKTSDGPVFKQ
jgi:hypothetical protein